jgi:hypothetical protein
VQWLFLSDEETLMRRILQLPLLFGIITFGACKPSKMHSSGPFTARLISSICGWNMVQLVSGNMDPARYSKEWTYDHIYHNVFGITNSCYFSSAGLHIGDTFQFKLGADTVRDNCAMCLAVGPVPPISNVVTDVKKIN